MLVFAVALVAAVRCAAAPRSDALAYEADGVAVWRGVVAADEVAALRGAYDAWAANASFDGAVTVNFCSPWPTLWPGAPACDSGVAPIVEDLRGRRRRADNRGDGGARARLPAHARGRERRDEPAVVAGGGAGARLRAGARARVRDRAVRGVESCASADLPLLSALQCAALAASGLRPFPFACLDVHGFAGETAALWPRGGGRVFVAALSLGDAPAAARRAVLRRVAHFDAFWLLTAENGTATTFARRDAAPVAEHAAAAVVCPSGNYGSTAVTWTERRAATSREDFEEDVVVTVGARETLPVAAAAALAPCPRAAGGAKLLAYDPLWRGWTADAALERFAASDAYAAAAAGGDGLGALARRHAAACLRWTRLCVSQDLAAHEPCQGVLRGAVEPQHAPCVRHGALRGADGRARVRRPRVLPRPRRGAVPLEGPYDAPAAPAPAVAERREAVAGVLGPGCRRLCHVGANVLSPASYWLAVTHDDVDVTLFVVPAPQGGDDDDFRAAYDRRAETRNGTCVDWARSTVRRAGRRLRRLRRGDGRNLVGLGGFLWHAVPDGALAAAEAREAAAADAADVPDAEPRGAAAPDAGVALAPGWLAHHAGACDFVLVTCAREGDVARAREALGVIASAVLSAPRGPRRHALRFTVFCNHVAAKVLRRSMQRLMDMAWGRFGGEDLVVYFDATWPDRVPEAAKAHLMLFKPCATVKLFLPQILDPTIRWAVYLDTDVVFAADPAALWLGAVGTLAAAGAAVAAAAEHGDVAPSCEGSAEHYYNQSAAAGPSRAPSRTTARTRASSRSRGARRGLGSDARGRHGGPRRDEGERVFGLGDQSVFNVAAGGDQFTVARLPCEANFRTDFCQHAPTTATAARPRPSSSTRRARPSTRGNSPTRRPSAASTPSSSTRSTRTTTARGCGAAARGGRL
ncbi:hypothetical protein JL722_13221 [Aureococcus anophagefferens]|nr:hypothetical protein JL722_13221 [Aureococcus anophagefferens]